jgi:hypothetical protein
LGIFPVDGTKERLSEPIHYESRIGKSAFFLRPALRSPLFLVASLFVGLDLILSTAILVTHGRALPFGAFLGIVLAAILLIALWCGALRQHENASAVFQSEQKPAPGSQLNKAFSSYAAWMQAALYCVCMALGLLLIGILSILDAH